ncbi:MAG: hypothetical protein ACJ8OJ_12685 [Povalibacter sp.]
MTPSPQRESSSQTEQMRSAGKPTLPPEEPLDAQCQAGLTPQAVSTTAHKYIPVAAATTAIHGGSTLVETPSDANPFDCSLH